MEKQEQSNFSEVLLYFEVKQYISCGMYKYVSNMYDLQAASCNLVFTMGVNKQ